MIQLPPRIVSMLGIARLQPIEREDMWFGTCPQCGELNVHDRYVCGEAIALYDPRCSRVTWTPRSDEPEPEPEA